MSPEPTTHSRGDMYEGKNASELSSLNVPALKALCKGRGIKGYSKLRQAQLIEALETHDRENAPKPELAPIVEPITVKGRSQPEPIRASFTKYPSNRAKNRAKARRRAIRANGGVAGWA